jgi:fatty acid desaturase
MAPLPTELRQRTTSEVLPEHAELNGNNILQPQPPEGDMKCVGINGYWWDVTDFLPQHPGGPILEQFVGKDATAPFRTLLHQDVLKHRKPVGTYKMVDRHPADAEFEKLQDFFKENGFFTTNFPYYYKKWAFIISIFITSWLLVTMFDQRYMHYLGAVVLAFFFQQCGFAMHDLMHQQVYRNTFWDRFGGLWFGTAGFGFCAHWWQDEHIIHHTMCNVVNASKKWADPQMWELVWAQNPVLFPLFEGILKKVNWFFIKIQHITFVPIVVFIGRYEIIIDSYRLERRWYEWIAICVHWTWMSTLLSFLPNWQERAIFYFIAASVEGVFHFQLILSHYCKQFLTYDDYHVNSYYQHQIASNMNILNPWWQDWYYGGLNFHIEHHLFPKMARHKLREASPYIRDICERHNIEYDIVPFTTALVRTLVHLKTVSTHYSLDPR